MRGLLNNFYVNPHGQLSPGCFLADIPDHSFLSSGDQPDLELLAALESGGRYDSSAGPSAAVIWLASGKKGQRKGSIPLTTKLVPPLFLLPN